MARYSNPYAYGYGGASPGPYPTDPNWGAAAQSLGTALFGSPEMAAEQKLRQAQQANYTSEAANYDATAAKSRADALATNQETQARAGLPELFSHIYKHPVDANGQPIAGAPLQIDQQGLAATVAGLAILKGSDPAKAIAAVTGYSGVDPISRGALISQGVNPSADFAVNQDQAEGIAADKADAAKAQAESVANITGKYGVQEAGIHAGAEVRSAGIAAGAAKYGHDLTYKAATQDTAARVAEDKYRVDHGQEGKITPGQLGNIDAEINAQLGAGPNSKGNILPADLQTAVRVRAIDLARASGNPAAAVSQAIAEKVNVQKGGGFLGLGGPTYTARGGGNVIRLDNQGRIIR